MRPFLSAALLTCLMAVPVSAETWVPDPTHTEVVISWNHAGLSFPTAKFNRAEGTLEFKPGDIAGARAEFSVMADSIASGVPSFDADLKGANFFDVETFPTIRFVSTRVEQTGEMTVRATGDLTVKDVTAPVTFDITVHKIGAHPLGQFLDQYKGDWLGMTARASILRSEFGVDTFIPLGSDAVEITINTEMRAGGLN